MMWLSLLVVAWFAYWSAEAGASLPWSSRWQNYRGWNLRQVPEMILACSVALCGLVEWGLFGPWYETLGWFTLFSAVAYAGKQAATFAFLIWESHVPRNPDRQSTLRPLNDKIAKLFGWEFGDEGYSWVWAMTKGFIITAPVNPVLGAVFHPLGHELGSHAKGRLPGDPNKWKEIAGGAGLGVAIAIALLT